MSKFQWPLVWLEMAEAFATPYSQRGKRQLKITRDKFLYDFDCKISRGICHAIWKLTGHDGSSILLCLRPKWKLEKLPYWYSRTDRGDKYRAEFCAFMAGISHEDFERFIKEAE